MEQTKFYMNTKVFLTDLQSNIKDLEGGEIKFFKEVKNNEQITEPYTVRLAMRKAVANTFKDENMSGDQMLERFNLAQKIWNAQEELELTPTELSTVKSCVAKAFPIEAVGFIYSILSKSTQN